MEEFDLEEEAEAAEKPAYIDWQEFNRVLKNRNTVPRPEDDSKDDDDADKLEETVIGKNYLEEEDEDEAVLADTPSAARNINNRLEDISDETAVSSDRPDPIEDLDSETNTH